MNLTGWLKTTITPIVKGAKAGLEKSGPEIAIGVGIAGFIFTAILAAKAAPRADRKLTEAEMKKGEKLTVVETVVTAGKEYVPAIVTGALAATSIIFGTKELHKRNAALMALCAVAETSLADYKSQVVDTIGKEAEEEIFKKVDETRAKRIDNKMDISTPHPQVIDASMSAQPFYDLYSGRPFYSTEQEIEKVRNELNARINEHNPVSLNDFYYELNMEDVSFGDRLGWSEYTGLIDIRYGAYRDKNGVARSTISFRNEPRVDY